MSVEEKEKGEVYDEEIRNVGFKNGQKNMIQLFDFFFQAEDGIRDYDVTGVQTCALPISKNSNRPANPPRVMSDCAAKKSRSRDPDPSPAIVSRASAPRR